MPDPLIMFYEKMQTAETSLQFLRAWANYMLYVDAKSIEGNWALKASEEFQAALVELEEARARGHIPPAAKGGLSR